jgi:phage terminase large subunit-like protein
MASMNISDLAILDKDQLEEALSQIPVKERIALQYNWKFWARPKQVAPEGTWTYWLALAGRGWGKTRVGAEWVRKVAEEGKVGGGRIALVAPTNADLRDVMVEGESGILSVCPPWFKPEYQPSKRRVVFPNGVQALLFSAEEPDRLRGPQCGAFWADELAAWNHMEDTWSNLQFGFRLGRNPQGVITTTPRPVKLVRELVAMQENGVCVVTRGSTYDNQANLAPAFFRTVITAYEGTRLGRQELDGEVLEDNPNALFQQKWFNKSRLEYAPKDMDKIAVAVDPQVKELVTSDEAGIVIGGKKDIDGVTHYYITADDSFKPETVDAWGRVAVRAYFAHQADVVVAETNNGGQLVINNILAVNPDIPVEEVVATRGKTIRAEPVATLFEQGRVHLCGHFPELETQCTEWDPTLPREKQKRSPDRMDAMVWLIAYLSGMKGKGMVQGRATGRR